MKLEHRKVILKAMPFIMSNLIVGGSLLSHFEQQQIFDPESVEKISVS